MEKLIDFIKNLFKGELSRAEYCKRFIASFIILSVPSILIAVLSSRVSIDEQYELMLSATPLLITLSQFILVITLAPYILAIILKRLRDILPSQNTEEIYTVYALFIVCSFLVPGFSFLITSILLFAPTNAFETQIYKKYLQVPVENITKFFSNLLQKNAN